MSPGWGQILSQRRSHATDYRNRKISTKMQKTLHCKWWYYRMVCFWSYKISFAFSVWDYEFLAIKLKAKHPKQNCSDIIVYDWCFEKSKTSSSQDTITQTRVFGFLCIFYHMSTLILILNSSILSTFDCYKFSHVNFIVLLSICVSPELYRHNTQTINYCKQR